MKFPYKGGGIALFQQNDAGEYTVLLGKRINKPGKGKWSIPGGGYENKDSDLTETAKREFREETGLNLNSIVTTATPIKCHLWIPFVFNWITLIYVIKKDYRFRNNHFHEFSEVKQISLKDLKNYKLAFGVKSEVRTFKRKNKMED